MEGGQRTTEPDGLVRSGHKGGDMTTSVQRIEVITRGDCRRRWSIEAKREIVAESLQPGIRPSAIIRKHGITSGQLYAWRQQLTRRLGGELAGPARGLARVVVGGEREAKPVSEVAALALAKPPAPVLLAASPGARGLIEIVLSSGTSVRVDADVDDRALRCVLGALAER
jgi:transposase